MTEEQIQNAKPLTPGLESLLRSVDLHESVLMAFRVQEILDKELFAALDTTEETLRTTCKEGFGIDPAKGFHSQTRTREGSKSLNRCKSTLRNQSE